MANWFAQKLASPDRVERHYAYLLMIIFGLTIFFILAKPSIHSSAVQSLPISSASTLVSSPSSTDTLGTISSTPTSNDATNSQNHSTHVTRNLSATSPLNSFSSTRYQTLSAVPEHRFDFPLFWGSPLCTFWMALLVVLGTYQARLERVSKTDTKITEFSKFAIFLLLLLVVPVYYEGSNIIQRYRYSSIGNTMLWDSTLLRVDTALLGWLFPYGQMALWLDHAHWIGVTTTFGHCMAELLQTMYVSYYFWGNALGVYLYFCYYMSSIHSSASSLVSPTASNTANKGGRMRMMLSSTNLSGLNGKRLQWRHIQMFTSAWVGGFLLNFCLSLMFPAVSPRVYIASEYTNEIHGIFLCDILRKGIASAAANTFSAFPSGHCGLSWLCPLLAHRMGFKKYRNVTAFAAAIITLATLWMRYHYFADFLGSASLVLFGAWLGGFQSQSAYIASLEDDRSRSAETSKDYLYNGEEAVPLVEVAVIGKDELVHDQDFENEKNSNIKTRNVLMDGNNLASHSSR